MKSKLAWNIGTDLEGQVDIKPADEWFMKNRGGNIVF